MFFLDLFKPSLASLYISWWVHPQLDFASSAALLPLPAELQGPVPAVWTSPIWMPPWPAQNPSCYPQAAAPGLPGSLPLRSSSVMVFVLSPWQLSRRTWNLTLKFPVWLENVQFRLPGFQMFVRPWSALFKCSLSRKPSINSAGVLVGGVGRWPLPGGPPGRQPPPGALPVELLGVAVHSAPRALGMFENWCPFGTPPISHWLSVGIFSFSVTGKHTISASDDSCQGKRKVTLENETRCLKEPALLRSGA